MTGLNASATALCDAIEQDADRLRVDVDRNCVGTRIMDCGVAAEGGLAAGLKLAEVCLAGRGSVQLQATDTRWPRIAVQTDHPVAACMASQYAGWQISGDEYFAMGSGPMRAAAGREEIFESIDFCESTECAVGVLETAAAPAAEICSDVAHKCGIAADRLTLLIARTASQAGTLQIVARSVETTLHKLFELKFDLRRVISGYGTAPLPPVAKDDLTAVGRTNDAILYGAQVTLWVRGDDSSLEQIGPKIPSSASSDHGRPFGEIFASYDHDFYRIDPHLFSPAVVQFCNLDTGRSFQFGRLEPGIVAQSFS